MIKNTQTSLTHLAEAHAALKTNFSLSSIEDNDTTELNSYKFPKPRVYNPNLYESNGMSTTDLLVNITTLVGPKERPAEYVAFLNETLQKSVRPRKLKATSVNNIEEDPVYLKSISLTIDRKPISALMDTGSTHNLLSHAVFQTLQNRQFKPINMDMKVAGATLCNNIVGKTQLNTVFSTTTGSISIPVTYLIAHKLNGYQSILGAEMLTNPRLIKATTPYHIHLNETFNNAVIPLLPITKPPNFNSTKVEKSEEEQALDSIDEEIIQEHILIDPTKLNETFSHLDCEINPSLDKGIRDKLCKIIEDNRETFATTKLDVGKYQKFLVKLEIDDHIPSEKKRFMSEEKADFCDKTFEKFESLGIIEECHTPKTVSNLLLVPKYEGVKDATKASTFLAEIKGSKNKQFRIVQDLRRINKVIKNVKRSLPKLPEHIFQKLKNKIVSSVDTLQAYWHLVLHPESRPYTCFYLKNRVMQFNRMPQGFISASACWDQAMLETFSPETLAEIKKELTPEEAAQLGHSFEEFFTFYQDDSWIFSDTPELHLLHLKVVLMAYKMHNIKLSPKKCTFFPDELTILGVSFTPIKAELALDKLKAQSMLDWEKPDSLYTLQSRLYSLNYWSKFIPALAELKFPLNQILRSQIFSWDEGADLAWNRIKALIALDIRLTVPLQNEKLLVTTDASKIACSAILWVYRDSNLHVVACHSKLFSHTDSLKSIHFKETYALISAFAHFRPYLLNTNHPVTVFTDARALIWVGRNREYSIACNSLANKLAQLQIEIPYIVYSVPSETNFLADIFSRSFNTSRFLDKQKFALSKIQASKIPPLTEPCILDEASLYSYFTNTLNPEESDVYPRNKPKISTPKPIKNLYKLFESCTPEEKYYSAIRLLQGWNDPTIKPAVKLNAVKGTANLNTLLATEHLKDENGKDALELLEENSTVLFTQYCKKIIDEIMNTEYKDLEPHQRERLKNTLDENYRKLIKQNMRSGLKKKFINHEVMLNNVAIKSTDQKKPDSELIIDHEQPVSPVYYSMLPQAICHPKIGHSSPGIDLPLQADLNLDPGEDRITDTGIQFYIPSGYYMQLAPRSSAFKFNIHLHQGVIDNDFNGTVKLLIRNNSADPVKIPMGTFLVQGLIIPVIHPHLHEVGTIQVKSDRKDGMLGSSDKKEPLTKMELLHVPISPIHALLAQKTPVCYNVPEINTSIMMPMETSANISISHRISQMNDAYNRLNLKGNIPPLVSGHCAQAEILTLTRSFVNKTAHLNAIKADLVPLDHQKIKGIKNEIYEEMCKKLAIISVDLIKNQTITSAVLAKAQQGDDLLSTIRDNIHTDAIRNKGYVIKDQVLYKTYKLPYSNVLKYALCVPDILLPAVIHYLHTMLGHPTYSTMLRNFRIYYHSPAAQLQIKLYVEACTTCALANKYDIKKVVPSVERTMKPTRPRQHLYADLIPMFKGTFSYILFALDAYSQYIYAIPLKDKTSASVLQGFLSIFGTTGWYENIYLDNETSFVKTAKMLVKIAPIQVHYSTPYCHFQNSSENYIKNFKKTFLKILNDQEDPHENSDWPLLLPTVVQALNRQIISSLGISREHIHFNSATDFYPLAELTHSDNAEINAKMEDETLNHFKKIVLQRKKHQKYSNKAKVPQYTEKAIVFMRDMIPSVSNILKIPQRGPFQITEINERNVTLLEPETGQTVHTHIELIRPLDLKEFKLLLNKKWDLNVHHQKAIDKKVQPGIFDEPSNPVPLAEALEQEPPEEIADEIDLEALFYPPPKNASEADLGADLTNVSMEQPQNPAPKAMLASLNQDIQDEFDQTETNVTETHENDLSQINSLHAYRDLSKPFRDILKTRKEKLITFFLSKHDQYIKLPPRESEID